MPNPFFRFKQFTVFHDRCAMKVTTDACLFGAWCAELLAGQSGKAIDIGTGTGLLSLMIAQKTDLSIDAIEIDPAAAEQAMENRTAAAFGNMNVLTGNLLQLDLPKYDVIFSNPPFYESEIESADAGKRIAHHGDGLSWSELFEWIAKHLEPDGKAFLLLPEKRRDDLAKLLAKEALYCHREVTVVPAAGRKPSRLMVMIGKERVKTEREELLIADGSGYTQRFAHLLRDYYLYL